MNEVERRELEEQDDRVEKLIDRLTVFSSEIYGHAAAYDNAVIIAGYAAFFALWSGVSADVSPIARSLTVALMGISLMLYVSWHILQMVVRGSYDRQRGKTVSSFQDDPIAFDQAWQTGEVTRARGLQRTLRFWPFIFLPSVAFGFLGASVLTYSSLAITFGFPEIGR